MARVSFAELDGVRVTELCLTLPLYGRWTADLVLDTTAAQTSGRVLLSLGELELNGIVARAGDLLGVGQLRLMGGKGSGGGWGKRLPAKPYQSPGGLRLQGVLVDAARGCGEEVELQEDRTIGFHYIRREGPASQVLKLASPGWWVRPDGVTEVGTPPSPTITSDFDVFPESDLGRGRILIATDKPEDWAPGCKFATASLSSRVYTVSAVVHRLTPKQFRTEVWVSP